MNRVLLGITCGVLWCFAGQWGVAVNVRGADLDQLMVMPPSVRDWLPEDHRVSSFLMWWPSWIWPGSMARIALTVGRGGAVYDPSMMLAAVLLYAYCTGEQYSRRMKHSLVEDVAYRVLAANRRRTMPRWPGSAAVTRTRSPGCSARY